MTTIFAKAEPLAEVTAIVTRCGCSEKEKRAPDFHAKLGLPCPKPRRVKNLGRVSVLYRNPLRNFAWKLSQWIRLRRAGTVRVKGA